MCNVIGQVITHALNRQHVSIGAAVFPAAPRTPAVAPVSTRRQRRIAQSKTASSRFGTRLVLLGTAGGPTYWTQTNRQSTSSAIVVGDAVYLVDCGDGVGKRLQEALRPENNLMMFSAVRALFLTHLHSDHIIDYPNLLLYGWLSGLGRAGAPMKVFGPGRRGEMEPVFAAAGSPLPALEPVNPGNPTPGTEDMTRYLYQAFATDINDRIRDNGRPDLRSLVVAHDIKLPEIRGFASPNVTPHPDMEPFTVYEDDRVRVSATLVSHFPIWPAFAFRFDTDDGSVVFSGDTAPSQNLIRMAKGAAILVHEVIVSDWVNRVLPAPRAPAEEAMRQHSLNSHTPVEEVGKVAEAAGVPTLVLNHIVPGNARDEDLLPARHGFSGRFVIGQDLLQIDIRRDRG